METVLLGALGLAGAAGLNAWLPMLIVAIAGRSGAIDLSDPYTDLTTDPALVILAVGFAADFVGDKIPAVDHALHAIGNVVHPIAGGVVAASQAGTDVDPTVLLVAGAVTSGGIHIGRESVRPFGTVLTGGIANPIMSLIEDVGSLGIAVLALAAPVIAALLVVGLIALIIVALIYAKRWRDRRRAAGLPPEPREPV
jgi:hypothetical protein